MQDDLKVLLVDDEESIKKVVEQIMHRAGYNLIYASNGEEALAMFKKENPALIILDVMLPIMDGFEVCRIIRQQSSVPIIFLSAKNDIVDKTIGFNLEADDYLAKPFSPLELSLRVKALIRRTSNNSLGKCNSCGLISIKGLEIDCNSYEVTVRGKKIDFTPKEFEMLCFIASHPGQVFTREQLLNQLWGEDYVGDISTITVFMRKIREKVELDPSKPKFIQTVWGVGYKFCHKSP